MEKLIEIIEALEQDFENLNMDSQVSKDNFKTRALEIVPTIMISKEADHNAKNIDLLDSLNVRIAKIVSQL